MPTYVLLMTWTDRGVATAQDTIARSEEATTFIASLGGQFQSIFWTMGRYDMVGVVEAPDDATLATILLRLGAAGNVRTETLRAFAADEMRNILATVP